MVGHSLGAGVACLLALILRTNSATRHWQRRLACRLLSPVGGLLSKRIADATGDALFHTMPFSHHGTSGSSSKSSSKSSSDTYDVAAAAVLNACSDSAYSGSRSSGPYSSEDTRDDGSRGGDSANQHMQAADSSVKDSENTTNKNGSESIAWDCASVLFRDEAVPRLSVREDEKHVLHYCL